MEFSDTILEQKKPFSVFVFVDIVEKLLLENPTLKELLNQKIKADEDFAGSLEAQLD